MAEEDILVRITADMSQFVRGLASGERSAATLGRAVASLARSVAKSGGQIDKTYAQTAQKISKDASDISKSLSSVSTAQERVTKNLAASVREIVKEETQRLKVQEQQEKTTQQRIRTEGDLAKAAARQSEAAARVTVAETRLLAVRERGALSTSKFSLSTLSLSNIMRSGLTPTLTAMVRGLTNTVAASLNLANALGLLVAVARTAVGVFTTLARIVGGILANAFRLLIAPIRGAVSQFIGFINRVAAVAVGVLIRDVIFFTLRSFKELASTVIETAKTFQVLEIRLETLAARQIRMAYSTMSVTESMNRSVNVAKELTRWILDLGRTVPFDVEAIANTQAFAQAMGFAITEAQSLTKAVLEYTAAMGLGSEVAERIIFNFGQMKAQGKVTSTEMRDLARGAFFPLTQVLDIAAEKLGVSAENLQEFREAAAEGAIDINTFFEAFEEFVASDFPGALERMGKTLQGATIRLRNLLKELVGIEMLGPLADRLGELLSGVVDTLSSPVFKRAAQFIGQTLVQAFEYVLQGVRELNTALGALGQAFGLNTQAGRGFAQVIVFIAVAIRRTIGLITSVVQSITERISGGLQESTSQAATWGYNLVATFARGMSAAIKLIVIVINAISKLIAFWFRGFSPPRIAPDLDKWGAQAISEWFKGWTKFDVSVFADISSTIESFLRSISSKIGGKEGVNLIPFILGSRQVIAQAINDVRAGLRSVADAADYVFRRVGNLTQEFRDYIKALFEVEAIQKRLADATRAVAEAQLVVDEITRRIKIEQDELNDVTDKYEQILDDLNSQLEKVTDEYDEQQRLNAINLAIGKGLLTEKERERLEMEKRAIELRQTIRDTEDERDAALEVIQTRLDALEAERDLAQAKVDAAEAAEAAIRLELDSAQERLDTLKAIIDEQIKQNELIQEQLDLLESLKKAASGGAGAGAGAEGGALIDWESLLDIPGMERSYSDMAREAQQGMRIRDEIEKMFEDMETAVTDFETAMSEALSPLTEEGGALSLLAGAVTGLYESFLGIKTDVPASVVIGPYGDAFATAETPSQRFSEAIREIVTALGEVDWEVVVNNIVTLIEALAKVDWQPLVDSLVDLIEGFNEFNEVAAEEGPVAATMKKLGDVIGGGLSDISKKLAQWIVDFLLGWTGLKIDLVGNSIVPEMMQDIYDEISGKLDEVLVWLTGTWIIQTLAAMLGFALSVVGPGGVIPTMMSDLWTVITTEMTSIKSEWDTRWTAFKTYVEDIWNAEDGIIAKVRTAIDTVASFFGLEGTLATAIKSFVTNVLDWFKQKIDAVAQALRDLKDAWNSAQDATGGGAGKAGKQFGGPVFPGRKYVVGERGREFFVPAVAGLILPNWMTERILAPPVLSQAGNTYITNIEVNPTYSNIQSEASVYYDVTAALSAARR